MPESAEDAPILVCSLVFNVDGLPEYSLSTVELIFPVDTFYLVLDAVESRFLIF